MPQYLSTDPRAGQPSKYLSTDPAAGREQPSRTGRFVEGGKQGLSDLWQIARHPIDTVKGFGGALVEGAKAVPDVARLLVNPETRGATARGFTEGAAEGATGLSVDEAKRDPFFAAGRFTTGVVLPAVTLKGAPRLARMGRRTPGLVAESNAGAVLTEARPSGAIRLKPAPETATASAARVPYRAEPSTKPAARPTEALAGPPRKAGKAESFEQALADELKDLAKPAPAARVSLPPEPQTPAGLRTRAPAPKAKKPEPKAPEPKPVIEAPVTATPEAAQARASATLRAGFTADMPTVAEARRALGSQEAATMLGVGKDDVKRLAPGPSRRPLVADLADLDLGYQRMLASERGAASPGALRTLGAATAGGAVGSAMADENPIAGGLVGALGGAALANPTAALKQLQQARMVGMLSGAALPKSAAGNVGAFLTAAAEKKSLRPVKELLRVPTNAREAVKGFRAGANPGETQGVGRLNVPGRLMGALDAASQAGLERAGLSTAEAQRLLLTTPNPLGHGRLGQAAHSPIGKVVFPFQRIPFNAAVEGIGAMNELLPGSGAPWMRRGLTLGSIGAGALSGDATDNPLVLSILAALAGPRAAPFALGAGATAGPRIVERVGVGIPEGSWKDLIDPLRPIDKPAILRLLRGN